MSPSEFPTRIHFMGAPGSGVSSIGRALAAKLGIAFFDTDDYYWFTGDPLPFKRKRNPEHRCKLLAADLQAQDEWVLSGSLCGWGDEFIPMFECVVFCHLETDKRLQRIAQREAMRYGSTRLQLGGDLEKVYHKFLNWAAAYDQGEMHTRSSAQEQAWLEKLNCRVIRIHTDATVSALVSDTIEQCIKP